jgi:hypothetical protein
VLLTEEQIENSIYSKNEMNYFKTKSKFAEFLPKIAINSSNHNYRTQKIKYLKEQNGNSFSPLNVKLQAIEKNLNRSVKNVNKLDFVLNKDKEYKNTNTSNQNISQLINSKFLFSHLIDIKQS